MATNPKPNVIDEIVQIEWEMFQAVNEGGPRASCQEDRPTFEHMRRAQFCEWSRESAASYLEDLTSARKSGRNLVREKYIHMMERTDPQAYEQLKNGLVVPGASGQALVREIGEFLTQQTEALFARYPLVAATARPSASGSDAPGDTSVETYQHGELLTYSERTLEAYKKHLLDMASRGMSFAEAVMTNTVRYYGYRTLDEAERALQERRR